MNQTLISVGLFVLLLAAVPFGIKWVQRRSAGGVSSINPVRLIAAVAVGPHQRVVTVEAGPDGARVWLTLGVTAQTITTLHVASISPAKETERVSDVELGSER